MFDDKNNAGAILNLPYSLQAAAKGMHSLGRTTDMLGPYQAGGAFVRRAWARENAAVLEQLSRRVCRGAALVARSEKPRRGRAILVDKLKLPQDIAEKSLALMAEPGFGFARDAAFDMAGFKNVLALRAEVEGGAPSDPQRYIDLSYYDRAMTLVNKSTEPKCPPPLPKKQKISGCSATMPRRPGAAAAWCRFTRATPMSARSAARATTARKASPCTTCAIRRSRKKSANSARRPASIATSCASSATICST